MQKNRKHVTPSDRRLLGGANSRWFSRTSGSSGSGVNMSKRLLLIFTLICTTGCKRYPHYSVENLYAVLDRTSEYFETLRNGVVSVAFARSSSKLPRFTHTKLSALLAHESPNASASNVDGEIAEYMEATTKAIVQRQRRSRREDLQPSEGELRRKIA